MSYIISPVLKISQLQYYYFILGKHNVLETHIQVFQSIPGDIMTRADYAEKLGSHMMVNNNENILLNIKFYS